MTDWTSEVLDFHVNPNEAVETDELVRVVGRHSRVLDYGCGFGRLAEHFPSYVGVDVAEHRLDIARESWPEAEFYTVEEMKIRGMMGCEVVVFCNVLLHVSDDDLEYVLDTTRTIPTAVVCEHLGRHWRREGFAFNRELSEYAKAFGAMGRHLLSTTEVLNPAYDEDMTISKWGRAWT